MKRHLYVSFDELERPIFAEVSSASVLSDSRTETTSRTTIVRRAAQGDPLDSSAIHNLKMALEGAVEEREQNVEKARLAGEEALAEAFATWLVPLGEAWGLACEAEAVVLGGFGVTS